MLLIGALNRDGLFSFQLEGGQGERKTGLQIVVTGTTGALRITSPHGFENTDDNALENLVRDATNFSPLEGSCGVRESAEEPPRRQRPRLAYLYDAYAHNVANGTSTVTTFTDAVNLHRLLDQSPAPRQSLSGATRTRLPGP